MYTAIAAGITCTGHGRRAVWLGALPLCVFLRPDNMRTRIKIALAVCALAFTAFLFIISPFFHLNMENLRVTGCEKISREEIIARAGLNSGTHLLFLNTAYLSGQIMENLYVDNVTFEKNLPGSLSITIRERRLTGYMEYEQGKYLYIDENGRVLEISDRITEKHPMVGGLKFTRVRLGELLEVEDPQTFKTMVTYARLLVKYNITDEVYRIDLSDSDNARILMYHLDFNVGDAKNADEKVRTLMEIIKNLPNADIIQGVVDLREINRQYFMKILV
jgi:cell division septal protein FtsQ